nr:hypothetical protein CFP56_45450 [Quercus suber]
MEVGGRRSQGAELGGGAEAEGVSVTMMEAEQMGDHVKSFPREHGELDRWEMRLPEASDSGKNQWSRAELKGNGTKGVRIEREETEVTEVGQQVGDEQVGPVLNGAEILSPPRCKVTAGRSGEIKYGPNLKENEEMQPTRIELKEHSFVDRTQSQDSDQVVTQGVKRRIKRIAREKRKAQEVVKIEGVQEVSNKRKICYETLLLTEGNVQKRLCVDKQEGDVNFLTKTAVTAEQHRLDQ